MALIKIKYLADDKKIIAEIEKTLKVYKIRIELILKDPKNPYLETLNFSEQIKENLLLLTNLEAIKINKSNDIIAVDPDKLAHLYKLHIAATADTTPKKTKTKYMYSSSNPHPNLPDYFSSLSTIFSPTETAVKAKPFK